MRSFALASVCIYSRGIDMSVAMLTSLTINFSAFTASVPPTSSADRLARPVEQQDDEKPRFRESTLVSAMMAAFQALGIGQTAATTAAGSTNSGTSGASPVPATGTVGGTKGAGGTTGSTGGAGTTGTTGTTGATTTSTPAPDTLEKAVNEFAHALSVMLRRQGGGEHSDGQHDGEHTHGHEGHGQGGYNGLVQRLEKLAQSLGGATPASPSSTPAPSGIAAGSSGSPSDQTAAVPVNATSTTAPSTDPAPPSPNPRLERLLTAFTNVLNFLQPATASAAATPASGVPTDAPAATASVTDKLKLFLTSLAQSLNGGEKLSQVGSRVNYSV
jgi:hypothetical protein